MLGEHGVAVRQRRWVVTVGLVLAMALAGCTNADNDAAGDPESDWVDQFGTELYDWGNAVAANDSAVYVTGATLLEFPGSERLSDTDVADVFVRRYDLAGEALWTRQFGTSSEDQGRAIAVDDSGIYVAGSTRGALPGETSLGKADAFLRKYNTAGKVLWTRQFGTAGTDEGYGVAVDDSGVYVTGQTDGTFPGEASDGDYDAFLLKFDPDGELVWTRQFGSSKHDLSRAVAADASGIYVTGHTRRATKDLPPSRPTETDGFIRKYNAAGDEQWTDLFDTGGDDEGHGIAVGGSAVYVVGTTAGAFEGHSNSQGFDVLVRKYDTAGEEQWTDQFGGETSAFGYGIAADESGAYATGVVGLASSLHFSVAESEGFVRRYHSAGAAEWTRDLGSAASSNIGVAVVASEAYVAGTTSGALLGQANLGAGDAYVRKFVADGCMGSAVTIEGTDADDTLVGTADNDVIRGGAGNDVIDGGGGDDRICGGDGDDTVDGGAGLDVVRGEGGDDVLRGNAGDDLLDGGSGLDQIEGGAGNDKMIGDSGDDELWGGEGDDDMSGSSGHDELWGDAGSDVLRGNVGNDALDGGDGSDKLIGGRGTDSCTNGATYKTCE